MTLSTVLKRPSAFLPLAMSGAALAVVLGFLAIYGVVQQEDEGTAAHLFQLLLAGQVPIVAYFLFAWLPQAPKQAVLVLLLQIASGLLALLPVFILEL